MRLHVENDRLCEKDEAVLDAIRRFGPVSAHTLRRIVGSGVTRNIVRLQRCGYLLPRPRGTVGYTITDTGRRAF